MRSRSAAPYWLIVLTILGALALTVLPLPSAAEPYRPEFVALTLVYWCLRAPHRVGPGVGWTCGLALDALKGALLGQHALALVILAYLTLKLRLRIRVFPLGQQTLTVATLVAVQEFALLWIDGMVGEATGGSARWLPVLVTLVVWPPLVMALDGARARATT